MDAPPHSEPDAMHYTGSCQCGQVAFDVEGEIDSGLSCNCSMCARRASLLWFVPRERLQLRTPEKAIATYTFNNHHIQHRFCPTCGIHVFGEAKDPKGNQVAAINLRVIEDLDLSTIPVHAYDGRAL